ncbi:predicted protein [Lichtheimia corymbifera JMRC:FSU:9682]|uniref:Uncharacterized protein n=1 Tax=Lichtheimia corymbifera JMRC:FSU:9682 TaxID=1263082 RepID=A0A068RKA9_9FUNG|nr:predicted protein [Lichtheimia corymbifera JMRC:FSU:9682]
MVVEARRMAQDKDDQYRETLRDLGVDVERLEWNFTATLKGNTYRALPLALAWLGVPQDLGRYMKNESVQPTTAQYYGCYTQKTLPSSWTRQGFLPARLRTPKWSYILTVFEDDGMDYTRKYLLWLLGYFDGDGHVKWKVTPAVWPIATQL